MDGPRRAQLHSIQSSWVWVCTLSCKASGSGRKTTVKMAVVFLHPINFSLNSGFYFPDSLTKKLDTGICISTQNFRPRPRPRFKLVVKAFDNDPIQQSNSAQDSEVDNLGVRAALSVLRFYKREISPLLPRSCRYVPTCSEYSMEAYKRYGVAKGTVLTAWRICRCNPLGGSGYDPPIWFDEPPPPPEE